MTLTFRRGGPDDSRTAFEIFTQANADLERRTGTPDSANYWIDPDYLADMWQRRIPLFAHLADTADQFWFAEQDGRPIGYARSTLHDGVRELSEFFVLPGQQSAGVGRELLARAFPAGGARRIVIASTDIRALARYLKAGVYPHFPVYFAARKPQPVSVATDLEFIPIAPGPEALAELRAVDAAVLGFARDADQEFLLRDRRGTFFRRGGRTVGYGFVGNGSGPFALLDPADFPAVLARAETEAAERGEKEFGVNLPLVNRAAVDYLLAQGFRLDPFTVLFMTDAPLGNFEQYIISSPGFFL
ncbi:MAG TPA: GNAT family N-acetyltransferase [Roseiflexaceae bacterium]|nr:GNAT family N-acetyltransferase [Roseiflexaceae bacterium]